MFILYGITIHQVYYWMFSILLERLWKYLILHEMTRILFIQTIIANQHKKDISRDDIINLLIDVKMNGETLDSPTSVISPLPEYDF